MRMTKLELSLEYVLYGWGQGLESDLRTEILLRTGVINLIKKIKRK